MQKPPRRRLFVAADLAAGGEIEFGAAHAHYLGAVLRQSAGDEVAVFNGRDGEWRARLLAIGRGMARAVLVEPVRTQRAGPDLWLCFAPIKGQRLDDIAEKATELGVAVLQPVLTRRTAVSRVNLSRLEANAREAAEQCERLSVPEVREPVPLSRLLQGWPDGRQLLLCAETGAPRPVAAALAAAGRGGSWAILTGPEGGFAPEELQAAVVLPQVVAVSLGPRVLRAETAAFAALSVWQALCGDWDSRRE